MWYVQCVWGCMCVCMYVRIHDIWRCHIFKSRWRSQYQWFTVALLGGSMYCSVMFPALRLDGLYLASETVSCRMVWCSLVSCFMVYSGVMCCGGVRQGCGVCHGTWLNCPSASTAKIARMICTAASGRSSITCWYALKGLSPCTYGTVCMCVV